MRLSSRAAAAAAVLLALGAAQACDGGGTGSGRPTGGDLRGALVSGGGQEGEVGTALPEPLAVRVTDTRGEPIPALTVLWRASDDAPGAPPRRVATRADGVASVAWTLGTRAGRVAVRAYGVAGTDTVPLDSAVLTARAGAAVRATLVTPAQVRLDAGDSLRLRAAGEDAYGNPVAPDDFRAPWLSSAPAVATVDSAGRVRALRDGGAVLTATLPQGFLRVELRVGPDAPPPAPEGVFRIAFGSCNHQDLPQPLWEPILAAAPDLWVWLGDNVYGDTDDMAVLAAKYDRLRAHPGYAALRRQVPIVGTWDDHDYGRNNAGREYPMREPSKHLFLDFFDVGPADPRRDRPGVWSSHVYGEPGRRIKVILLDTRYHREQPGPTADVLGEEQWAWLEAELRGSDAQLHLIGTGIQVLPVDQRFEKWANFPQARDRLLALLRDTGAPGVVLLSGDRHFSELSRVDGALAYPLWEVTSSGMTHSWTDAVEENRYRVGEMFRELSFATLDVDWEAGTATVSVRDVAGAPRMQQTLALVSLRAAPARRR